MQPPTPPSRHRAASRLVAMAVVFAALVGLIANPGHAATSGKTITIGESNDEAQRQELLGYFGADPDDKVEIVGVEETQKAMAKVIPGFDLTSAFSSTALTCRDLGEGIDVSVINITKITPAMYAMALVTAGVGDAELIVAAPANAAAEGMTALAGIFQSWQSNPCAASSTSRARQQVALREIALALEVGPLIGTDTAFAGNFIIDVQRNVVIDDATSAAAVTDIVAGQEAVYGFTVPEEQRDKLVTLMVDLQELEIDWSTFSAGWTIEYPETGKVVMSGDGVAIANAQASATAEAAKEQTATARDRKRKTQTAVAEAKQTEAAAAEQTTEAGDRQTAAAAEQTQVAAEQTTEAGETLADQTRTAGDDLTATAHAVPTATSTPTPEPVAASGKITSVTAPSLSVDVGGQATEYRVMDAATITRDDKPVSLLDLQSGDAVALKVVTGTNQVVEIAATAPEASSPLAALSKLLLAIPLLALIPVGIVLRGRSFGDPFIVKRVSH